MRRSGRARSRATPRIIYITAPFAITRVEYTSRHRKIPFDLSSGGEDDGIVRRGHYRRRNGARSRTNALLEEGVFAHGSYQFPLAMSPRTGTVADRRDEWIIETSRARNTADERLLQIFVQLRPGPSLIAHRFAAGI